MKRFNIIFSLILLSLVVSNATTIFAQVHATSETNGTVSCKGCSVKNSGEAVDKDYINTYSTLKGNLKNSKDIIFQQFKFSVPASPISYFQMTVENNKSTELTIDNLESLSITSIYDGVSNKDTKWIKNITLQPISGSKSLYSIIVEMNTIFDEVEVRLTGGTSSDLKELNIYEVYYTPSIPLPIELIMFTGINQNGAVQLNWSTSSESNNSFFAVERSEDAVNFTTIGTVKGAGNTSTISVYSYLDKQPESETNYYRLKQTDFNGQTSYSETILINVIEEKKEAVIIGTNSFQDSFNIFYQSNKLESICIIMIDKEGKQIYISYQESNVGANTYNITNLGSIDRGIYTIVLRSNNELFTQKIIKL